KTNKSGDKKKNSAWKLNEEIWKEIEYANAQKANSSERYVSIYNFEVSNNYRQDREKGKPLSAYEFVKNIDNLGNPQILQFVKQIVGKEQKSILFSQSELEQIVKEPV